MEETPRGLILGALSVLDTEPKRPTTRSQLSKQTPDAPSHGPGGATPMGYVVNVATPNEMTTRTLIGSFLDNLSVSRSSAANHKQKRRSLKSSASKVSKKRRRTIGDNATPRTVIETLLREAPEDTPVVGKITDINATRNRLTKERSRLDSPDRLQDHESRGRDESEELGRDASAVGVEETAVGNLTQETSGNSDDSALLNKAKEHTFGVTENPGRNNKFFHASVPKDGLVTDTSIKTYHISEILDVDYEFSPGKSKISSVSPTIASAEETMDDQGGQQNLDGTTFDMPVSSPDLSKTDEDVDKPSAESFSESMPRLSHMEGNQTIPSHSSESAQDLDWMGSSANPNTTTIGTTSMSRDGQQADCMMAVSHMEESQTIPESMMAPLQGSKWKSLVTPELPPVQERRVLTGGRRVLNDLKQLGKMSQENDKSARKPPISKKNTSDSKSQIPSTSCGLPRSLVKSIFQHFSASKVSTEALAAVEQGSVMFFKQQAADLVAFSGHAGRRTIELGDVELLMKRQGLVTPKHSLNSLIEKFLPLEYRQELIPTVQSGNKLVLK
ncbi:centromere protein T [Nematostella vectensis]|uniref:centromere protein T n=1 Tax=Nematostella vectensis TaxID=45351 RepID=UPI0020774459|nr:centromere protein T [Nematostella vectensis]